MSNLKHYILERLKLTKNSIQQQSFTDKEMREDYIKVAFTTTKAEKQVYAEKYDIKTNKFRDIQIVILDELRKNRHNKTDFTFDDIQDFNRYDIKDHDYQQYLDEESIDFVEYMFNHYEEVAVKHNIIKYANLINAKNWNYRMSYSQRNILKKYVMLKEYLKK